VGPLVQSEGLRLADFAGFLLILFDGFVTSR
jgi:hypothetical protein